MIIQTSSLFLYEQTNISSQSSSLSSSQNEYDRQLVIMIKLYTDETRYSEDNDSFSYKLTIFHNICRCAEVSDDVKLLTFLSMLKKLALNYYYSDMNNDSLTFDQVCFLMINYFENAEYKRSILSR